MPLSNIKEGLIKTGINKISVARKIITNGFFKFLINLINYQFYYKLRFSDKILNMKLSFGRVFILLALLGFIGIGFLLLTNHSGAALKVANYVYFLILIGVVGEFIRHGKKE